MSANVFPGYATRATFSTCNSRRLGRLPCIDLTSILHKTHRARDMYSRWLSERIENQYSMEPLILPLTLSRLSVSAWNCNVRLVKFENLFTSFSHCRDIPDIEYRISHRRKPLSLIRSFRPFSQRLSLERGLVKKPE
jgi:hypothetical protein